MRKMMMILAVVLTATAAHGQTTWLEDGDAPSFYRQTTIGPGALTKIMGTLISSTDVDVFAVYIDDEANFSATTVGGATFDTTLYLFDASGNGVAMSDDTATGSQSTITSTFVTANNEYWLAVTGADRDPVDSAPAEIWLDTPKNAERGPDGPGTPGPLNDWIDTGASGSYSVFLTGARCSQVDPMPTGACCFLNDGSCQDLTGGECVILPDTEYHGIGTGCSPGECPPPPGACCDIVYGTCSIMPTETDCTNAFGEWMGAGITCEENPCPPIGACCDPNDGRCVMDTTWRLCEYYWHRTWLGEGTTCSGSNPCPQPPLGACCQPSGECQYLNEYNCVNQTSGGTWLGEGTVCDPNPCPQPEFGACCFPGGGCLEIEDWQCFQGYGTFQGAGTTCCPNLCPQGGSPGWGDGFEDYDAGTLLYHVGGWTGWDDSISAAGTVSAAQAQTGVHSIAVNGSSDAIHPFSPVYDGGQWTITAWQYLPSSLDSTSYFVVNTYYQHGGPYYWGVELHFAPWQGVYDALRDPSGASALPLIYNQWVEIRIEVDFEAGGLGTLWQYYNNQLVWTGNWITGSVGQLAIANIDLYAPHSEVVYYDDLSVRPAGASTLNPQRPLFTGVQYGNLPTRSTNLSGFPSVTWNSSFSMPIDEGVDGAAGLPDGSLYITSGAFTSKLYRSSYRGPAVDTGISLAYPYSVSGLAYGRGRLFGFCNYASPMGIYEINQETGAMTLAVDTGSSRRFFGLDYNATDGLLYGYDEYGSPSGLCSINIDTGVVTPVAGPIPTTPGGCENSAARGLACGYNKVYVVPVYGATCPMFVYDLAQGLSGTWQPMTHPYPDSNSTSGAAWIPGPVPGDMNCDGLIDGRDIQGFVLALTDPGAYETTYLDCTICNADVNDDGARNLQDVDALVQMLIGE